MTGRTTGTALADAELLAVTMVDNAGVARAKVVPSWQIEHVATAGVGISKTLGVYCADDHVTTSADVPGPDGDLRLVADLTAARPLATRPGWWWAPADAHTVDGEHYPGCQRGFLKAMVQRLSEVGLTMLTTFEIEWYLLRGNASDREPARGPAYGLRTIDDAGEFVTDLVRAMAAAGAPVEQIHAEYGRGQFEVSIAAQDPVAAADMNVFARHLVRSVAARHGFDASFSPMADPHLIGSGAHVHLSLRSGDQLMFAGGSEVHGLTREAAQFLGGILDALPGLTAVIAGGPASRFRLAPSMWSGGYACWGHENREAAVRLITAAHRPQVCNAEVKVVDPSANPYLALGALIAAGIDGLRHETSLPKEVAGDPSHLPAPVRPRRLPTDPADALTQFRRSQVLAAAMGPTLFDNVASVRTAEAQRHGNAAVEEVLAAHRWCY